MGTSNSSYSIIPSQQDDHIDPAVLTAKLEGIAENQHVEWLKKCVENTNGMGSTELDSYIINSAAEHGMPFLLPLVLLGRTPSEREAMVRRVNKWYKKSGEEDMMDSMEKYWPLNHQEAAPQQFCDFSLKISDALYDSYYYQDKEVINAFWVLYRSIFIPQTPSYSGGWLEDLAAMVAKNMVGPEHRTFVKDYLIKNLPNTSWRSWRSGRAIKEFLKEIPRNPAPRHEYQLLGKILFYIMDTNHNSVEGDKRLLIDHLKTIERRKEDSLTRRISKTVIIFLYLRRVSRVIPTAASGFSWLAAVNESCKRDKYFKKTKVEPMEQVLHLLELSPIKETLAK